MRDIRGEASHYKNSNAVSPSNASSADLINYRFNSKAKLIINHFSHASKSGSSCRRSSNRARPRRLEA